MRDRLSQSRPGYATSGRPDGRVRRQNQRALGRQLRGGRRLEDATFYFIHLVCNPIPGTIKVATTTALLEGLSFCVSVYVPLSKIRPLVYESRTMRQTLPHRLERRELRRRGWIVLVRLQLNGELKVPR